MLAKIDKFLGCRLRLRDIMRRSMSRYIFSSYSNEDELYRYRAHRDLTHCRDGVYMFGLYLQGYNDTFININFAINEKTIGEHIPRRISGGRSRPLERLKQTKSGLLR